MTPNHSTIRLAAAAAMLALCAATARASDVSWSVGIHAPVGPGVSVGTVISNRAVVPVVTAPVYAPPPVVYAPPPVVYAPPVVVPAPVVYAPAPVYAPYRWRSGRWVYAQPRRHPHHHHHPHGARYTRWDAPVYTPRGPGREIRH